MPRCPDGEQKVQKVGEYVNRTRSDQHCISVDTMTFIQIIPDFVDWMAFEHYCEQDGDVKGQITPDQGVTGPVDGPRLHRCKDAY